MSYRVPVQTAADAAMHAVRRVNRRILSRSIVGSTQYVVPAGVTWTVVNLTASVAQVSAYGGRQMNITVFDEEGVEIYESQTSSYPRYAQGKFVWFPGAQIFEAVPNPSVTFINTYAVPQFVLKAGSTITIGPSSGFGATYIVMDEVAT